MSRSPSSDAHLRKSQIKLKKKLARASSKLKIKLEENRKGIGYHRRDLHQSVKRCLGDDNLNLIHLVSRTIGLDELHGYFLSSMPCARSYSERSTFLFGKLETNERKLIKTKFSKVHTCGRVALTASADQ